MRKRRTRRRTFGWSDGAIRVSVCLSVVCVSSYNPEAKRPQGPLVSLIGLLFLSLFLARSFPTRPPPLLILKAIIIINFFKAFFSLVLSLYNWIVMGRSPPLHKDK